jgi:hypothetical protein
MHVLDAQGNTALKKTFAPSPQAFLDTVQPGGSGPAVFPFGFHLQVGPVTQEYHAQLLPCYTGIRLRHVLAHLLTKEPIERFALFRLRGKSANGQSAASPPAPATGPEPIHQAGASSRSVGNRRMPGATGRAIPPARTHSRGRLEPRASAIRPCCGDRAGQLGHRPFWPADPAKLQKVLTAQ